jgi:hypothetical protein
MPVFFWLRRLLCLCRGHKWLPAATGMRQCERCWRVDAGVPVTYGLMGGIAIAGVAMPALAPPAPIVPELPPPPPPDVAAVAAARCVPAGLAVIVYTFLSPTYT